MKTPKEIDEMRARLVANMHEAGADAALQGAATALAWVIADPALADQVDGDRALRELMARPAADRRRDWIAHGGSPDHWPADDG